MKPYEEQNDYELLGIPPDASPFEIRRAFQENFDLYKPDSIASYSFFSSEERKAILARLEVAYLRLINDESRHEYDRELIVSGDLEEGMQFKDKSKVPIPLYEGLARNAPLNHSAQDTAEPSPLQVAPSDNAIVREILERNTLAGCDLKTIRTALGVALDSIAQEIKVKIGILEAIEEDRYESLPPLAYLKGFIRSYTRCLHIGDGAVESYVRHLNP